MSIVWYAIDDDSECEDCQANADVGQIDTDGDWPSGGAPVHPNCRCVEVDVPDPQPDQPEGIDALAVIAAVAGAVEAHKSAGDKADPAGHLTAIDAALAGTGATLLTKHHNKVKAKKGRTVDVAEQLRAMQGQRQFRTVKTEPLKYDEATHTFRARVCNYDKVDTYRTSWAPSVFVDSLQRKLPGSVWAHNWERIIGRAVEYDANSTDPETGLLGLDVLVRLADFDAVPDARMAHSLLRDGIVDEFSFAFLPEEGEEDPQNPGVLRFTRAQLDEVSPVLVGSVPGTKTLSVRSDESVGRAAAADLLVRFGSGQLDLADALAQLKAGSRVSEASLPTNSNGTPMTNMKMRNVPHDYKPTNGPDSVCETCGGQPDIKAHRAIEPGDSRAVSDMLMGYGIGMEDDDLDPGTLAAGVDACIDDAIALFAAIDTTTLPPEAQQAIALLKAADVVVDQLMDALGVPDPDEQVVDGSMRAPERDPDVEAALGYLDELMGAG